jgi:putative transposase
MPQSLVEIYLHIIFSTKHRKPLIDDALARRLYPYITAVCNNLGCPALNVGGYHDHVHTLCRLSKNISLVDFMKELKGTTSKWVKTVDEKYANFYWQEGYGAFSVSSREVEGLRDYIDNQAVHHQRVDFKTEFLTILKQHNVIYDERYLWEDQR